MGRKLATRTPRRAEPIVVLGAAVALGLAGGASGINPDASIPDDPAHPYRQTICGQVWTPGRAVPALLTLVMSPTPPPPAPQESNFPAPQHWGMPEGAAFKFGDCKTGAMVTITPAGAALVSTVIHAADGGVAFITMTARSKQSFLVRAWSSTTDAYLGEYQVTP